MTGRHDRDQYGENPVLRAACLYRTPAAVQNERQLRVAVRPACALGVLGRVRAQARQAGGDLLLAAPRGPVRRVLALTGLIDVFSVYASVEDAVRIARPVVTGQVAGASRKPVMSP